MMYDYLQWKSEHVVSNDFTKSDSNSYFRVCLALNGAKYSAATTLYSFKTRNTTPPFYKMHFKYMYNYQLKMQEHFCKYYNKTESTRKAISNDSKSVKLL